MMMLNVGINFEIQVDILLKTTGPGVKYTCYL